MHETDHKTHEPMRIHSSQHLIPSTTPSVQASPKSILDASQPPGRPSMLMP